MARCSRILATLGILALVIATPIAASTVSGATYRGQVNVINTSYASANNSVPFTLNTQNLLDLKYINSSFTNVAVTETGGTDVPFMPAQGAGTDWIIWENDILQNATNSYYLYTGGSAMNGKLRYFPADGGMAVADAASLEPGSNFEVEVKGFVNTSDGGAAPYNNIAYKAGALELYTSAANTITATVKGTNAIDQQYNDGAADSYTMYGANWMAQSFTAAVSGQVTQILIPLRKDNAPTGNLNLRLYAATAGHVPTGAILATSNNLDVSTLAGGDSPPYAEKTFTFSTPYTITSGTKYVIVAAYSGGDASNHLHWQQVATNQYASGTESYSNNTGSSFTTETKDQNIKVYVTPCATISAAAQSPAEHNYKMTLASSTLTLYDGVTSLGTASFVGSVANTGDYWFFATGLRVPYVEYIKVTVGGTLKGHWYWENSATFTDQSGNSNTATPTFRTTTTDADVSASLVSFSAYAPSAGGVVATTTIVNPITTIPADPVVTDVVPHNMTNIPFIGTPISNYFVDNDIPEGLFIYPFMMIILALVVFVVFHFTRDIGWAGIAQFVISGLFIAWRLLPWPALFFFGVVLVFTIIKRRTISV